MSRRARTPVFQQMERTECGAACLGAILGYYGKWLSLEELRIECGVSRDGSRAGNIVRAARRLGLEAEGFRIDADELRNQPTPFVAFWSANHFVVVEGISFGQVHLNDPAVGRRRIGWAEFERNYSGIALSLEKGPDFAPEGRRPSVWAGIARRVAEAKRGIVFLALVSAVMVLPSLLVPNFSKLFVDYVLARSYDDWLRPLLIAMAGGALIQGALTWVQQTYLLRFETRLSGGSTSALIRKIVRLPIRFFDQRSPSELAVRATQTESLAQLLGGNLGTAVLSIPTTVLFAAIMLYFDIYLGLLALFFAVLDFAALALTARSLAERNQVVMIQQTKIVAAGASGLRMIADYKASGSESLLLDRINGLKARQENRNAGFVRLRYGVQAIPVAVSGLGMATLFTVGGLRVMSGDVTIGVLVAMQGLMSGFMGPVSQLIGMGQQVQNAQAYMTQIDDTLNQKASEEFIREGEVTSSSSRAARGIIGRVALDRVTFGYSPLEPPLVKDLSLEAEPGEWVAVVGRSGSGKSTVAKLLAGIEHPWEGGVLIDGKPLSDIPRAAFRNAVAVVDQNIVIFEGTVRENIAMWDPTMTDEAIVAAAKIAGIHDFIMERAGGYEAKLGEEGANLSGGQRALMDIARAIAARPAILILDEATAALDAVSEERLMANLRQLGCTCIIIAHRLSTIRDADKIMVLERGALVESGHHDALIAADGLYRRLVSET